MEKVLYGRGQELPEEGEMFRWMLDQKVAIFPSVDTMNSAFRRIYKAINEL